MPELAEVEYFRQQWNSGLGSIITAVECHPDTRIYRESPANEIQSALTNRELIESFASAKQLLFRFADGHWLGLHLGMTGRLSCESHTYAPAKWDHLVLRQKEQCLVFRDPRQFGLLRHHTGETPPAWWTQLPPPLLSAAFRAETLSDFLRRRKRSPLKAVLLMQDRFPGIGNWMADEILWRTRLHPATLAGTLDEAQCEMLYQTIREVCRDALRAIAGVGETAPPADLNVNIPDDWLFWHRWKDGGLCPRDQAALQRETIGGRTSCWCPTCQSLP